MVSKAMRTRLPRTGVIFGLALVVFAAMGYVQAASMSVAHPERLANFRTAALACIGLGCVGSCVIGVSAWKWRRSRPGSRAS